MANADPLSQVALLFEQWRSSRAHGAEPVPVALRQQAIALLTQYSTSKLITTLRISGSQLKVWREESQPPSGDELCVALPSPENSNAGTELTVIFANGSQLNLSGELSSEMVMAVIREVKS